MLFVSRVEGCTVLQPGCVDCLSCLDVLSHAGTIRSRRLARRRRDYSCALPISRFSHSFTAVVATVMRGLLSSQVRGWSLLGLSAHAEPKKHVNWCAGFPGACAIASDYTQRVQCHICWLHDRSCCTRAHAPAVAKAPSTAPTSSTVALARGTMDAVACRGRRPVTHVNFLASVYEHWV